jgi:DNA processing protein
MSEYPAGTQPDRVHFPRRNRIIAGLSRATIVVEAPRKSGALITARLANESGREVYVLPGNLDNPRAIGCLELLNTGAQAILSEAHLLELLGSLPALPPSPFNGATANASASDVSISFQPLPNHLPPEQLQILQLLSAATEAGSFAAVPFDVIVQGTQLPAGIVLSALLQLEIASLVTLQPGMRYQRV